MRKYNSNTGEYVCNSIHTSKYGGYQYVYPNNKKLGDIIQPIFDSFNTHLFRSGGNVPDIDKYQFLFIDSFYEHVITNDLPPTEPNQYEGILEYWILHLMKDVLLSQRHRDNSYVFTSINETLNEKILSPFMELEELSGHNSYILKTYISNRLLRMTSLFDEKFQKIH